MEFEMTTDRGTILSTMYQDDEDVTTGAHPPLGLSGRTRRIRVGAIEYEVPTVEYVRQLEQTLIRHSRAMEHQQRLIERLVATLSKTNHSHQGQTREMEELRREMSRKINQRDYL
jgi:hypothetical protein